MRCSGAKDAVIETVGFGTSSTRILYVRTVGDKCVGKTKKQTGGVGNLGDHQYTQQARTRLEGYGSGGRIEYANTPAELH